ncbi:MAG TPA: acyltransferase [Chitinophagaceae bacterium]|nr:acyltransferase [Chitinophagaceae bacterium]
MEQKIIPKRIFGLDVMRAIAILFVLLSHTVFLLPFSKDTRYLVFQYFGFFGVEIFFVLSGYLVGKILIKLLNKRPVEFKTVRHFWIRRWFRTLPGYYLALLLTTIVYGFSYKQFVFAEPYNLLYLVFLQNFISPHPNFFPLAWSLSIEEWFYLLFPLWFVLISWLSRNKKNYQLVAILSFLLVIVTLRVIVVAVSNPEWDDYIKRIVPLRLDALATGVLAGFIHIHFKDWWGRNAKAFLGSGLILFAAVSVYFLFKRTNIELPGNFFWKTFYFNVVSFAIAFTLPYLTGNKIIQRGLFSKFIVHISLISYSLYLTHLLVMFVIITLLNKISVNGLYILKFICCWFFCILCATIFYRVYELPTTNLRDRFGK